MRFVSRRSEFRLVIRPTDRIMDESRRPVVIPGERIEFKQYQYNTNDAKLITYLKSHPLYGRDFTSEAGGDPTVIDKPNLVFDDGADLTGPKIVSGFPELKKPVPSVEMIHGAVSTVEKSGVVFSEPTVQNTNVQLVTKEDVEQMIETKLDGFLDKINSMLNPPKSKDRVFKCPICKEAFPSGFKVGEHKKLAHPQPE
jgi:hypothetical protein